MLSKYEHFKKRMAKEDGKKEKARLAYITEIAKKNQDKLKEHMAPVIEVLLNEEARDFAVRHEYSDFKWERRKDGREVVSGSDWYDIYSTPDKKHIEVDVTGLNVNEMVEKVIYVVVRS